MACRTQSSEKKRFGGWRNAAPIHQNEAQLESRKFTRLFGFMKNLHHLAEKRDVDIGGDARVHAVAEKALES